MTGFPKISIITPSFNQGLYLQQTIESVLSQDYDNMELIVVDGGSTDNSIEIIKKYDRHLAWWVKSNVLVKVFYKNRKHIINFIY